MAKYSITQQIAKNTPKTSQYRPEHRSIPIGDGLLLVGYMMFMIMTETTMVMQRANFFS